MMYIVDKGITDYSPSRVFCAVRSLSIHQYECCGEVATL